MDFSFVFIVNKLVINIYNYFLDIVNTNIFYIIFLILNYK